MSLSDIEGETISLINLEIESNDRSLTERNFSNQKKYLAQDDSSPPAPEENIKHGINKSYFNLESPIYENLPYEENGSSFALMKENSFSIKEPDSSHSVKTFAHQSTINHDLGVNKIFNRVKLTTCNDEKETKSSVLLNKKDTGHDRERAVEQHIPMLNASLNKTDSSQNFNFSRSKDFKELENDAVNNNNNIDEAKLDHSKSPPVKCKPMKVFCQAGSKSMNEINNISTKVEGHTSELRESSQSVEDLIFSKDNMLLDDDETYRAPTSFYRNENNEHISVNRKCHSSLGLNKEQFNPSVRVTKSLSPYQLNKKKSYSLSHLSSFRKTNYDHIQSKVKQYIKERKIRDSEVRNTDKSKSRSLPVTPLKRKKENNDVLLLDEKILESLSFSIGNQKEDLSEDLKKMKLEAHDENARLKVFDTLFTQLKEERECRIDLGITLNALQLDYDNLLTKYAQAKNMIDNLRFSKDVQEKENSSSTSRYSHFSKFKKAFSTSNIFLECSSSAIYSEAVRPASNLVKSSSSSFLVDPDISMPVKISEDKGSQPFIDLKSASENRCSPSSENSVCEWLEKCEYVHQKLREYMILETSSAFKKEERNIVWNFILEKYSELSFACQSLNEVAASEHGCKRKLEEIREAIEAVSTKFGVRKNKQIKQKPIGREYNYAAVSSANSNIPANSSYPYAEDSYFKHDKSAPSLSSKFTGTERGLPIMKQIQQKDIDSGCPPSDRSTRNSQFPSFDQSESLNNSCGAESNVVDIVNCNSSASRKAAYICENSDQMYEEPKRTKYFDKNLLNLSSINLGIEENCRRRKSHHNRKAKFNKTVNQNLLLDEDYDASGSSELEDLGEEEEKIRKFVKKKHPKVYKTLVPTRTINKYDDKFVCCHRSDLSKLSATSSQSVSTKNHVIGLSQIEKNSKHFQIQVNDLKSKGLHRNKVDKNNSKSFIPSRQSTPLKAISKDCLSLASMSSDLSHSLSYSHFSENKNYHDLSSRSTSKTLADGKKRFYPRSIENCTEIGCQNREINSSQQDSLPSSNNNVFTSSTPKSIGDRKVVDRKRYSSPPTEEKYHADSVPFHYSEDIHRLDKRSQSVPSLHNCENISSVPLIYIEHYNCPGKLPNGYPCHCCHSSQTKTEHLSYVLKKNVRRNSDVYEDKYPSIFASLNEATSIAEAMRLRSQNVLSFLRTDLLTPPRP